MVPQPLVEVFVVGPLWAVVLFLDGTRKQGGEKAQSARQTDKKGVPRRKGGEGFVYTTLEVCGGYIYVREYRD